MQVIGLSCTPIRVASIQKQINQEIGNLGVPKDF